jgi:uncharacterized protein (DUF2249 family)
MKIAEVLKAHPQLLDVFTAQSDEFKRLHNPVLRQVFARLTSVSQAARVAGVDERALLKALNEAIGENMPQGIEEQEREQRESEGSALPDWLDPARVTVTLDTREDQRRGEEPFHRIMDAAQQVKPGDIMLLRNTFDPLPLYDVLGKLGFEGWGRQIGERDWEVFFGRVKTRKTESRGPSPARTGQPAQVIELDNRGLEPPQPLVRIMNALAEMGDEDILVATMPHRPMHLYPILEERGYSHHTEDLPDGGAKVVIKKTPLQERNADD